MKTISLVPGYLLSCSLHSSSYYLFSYHPIPVRSWSSDMPLSNSLNFPYPSLPDLLLCCSFSFPSYKSDQSVVLTTAVIPSLFLHSLFILLCFFIPGFFNFSVAFLVVNILSLCPILFFIFIFLFALSHYGDFWVIYGDGSPLEKLLATT